MNKKALWKQILLSSALLQLGLTACSTTEVGQAKGTADFSGRPISPNAKKIAVDEVTFSKTACCWESERDHLVAGIHEMLSYALNTSGSFIVLEKPGLGSLDEENKIRGTDSLKSFAAADYILRVAVTEFKANQQGGSVDLGSSLNIGGFGLKMPTLAKKQSRVALDVRVIDTRTRRVVASTKAISGANKVAIDNLGFSFGGFSPTVQAFKSPSDEEAAREAVAAAVDFLTRSVSGPQHLSQN